MNYVSDPAGPSRSRDNLAIISRHQEVAIADTLRLFWRRKALFFGVFTFIMAIAILFITLETPVFTAKTDIILENREHKVADVKAVLGDVLPDKEGLLSEMEVIRSRGLAQKVIDRLDLWRDPEFNESLRPQTYLHFILSKIGKIIEDNSPPVILDALSTHDEFPLSDSEKLAQQRERVVDSFLKDLGVSGKGQSRVIEIFFTSEDPAKAAKIVDTVADTYIVEQLEAKYVATQRANEWLSGKLQELRKKVAESEGAVEEYRRRAGLLQGKEGTLLSQQQVSDLNSQLIVARTERAAAEARYDQVKMMLRAPGGAETNADVLGSPIIQDLVRQEAEVKRKVAELEQELGDRHPRLISARAELSDIEAKIKVEVNKVVQKLGSDAAVARAREAALQRSLQELEARLAQANASEVQLRALERESDANKVLLQQFLSRSEEITAQTDLVAQQTNARVLSAAVIPDKPSAPKVVQILALTFLAATAIAALVVVFVENLDRGYRSGDQIEHATGARCLGLIPIWRGRKRDRGPHNHIVKSPASLFGESVRAVYTSVLVTANRPSPRTVLITSSQPKEGKTTLATCLTRVCTIAGKKAVIVEADLRKPSVHRYMAVAQAPGVTEFCRGEANIDEVLHQDPETSSWIVPSGKLNSDPTKVLNSTRLRTLLSELSDRFDLVIIDSPPVMAVADARLLAPHVDATVFVVRWAGTHRQTVIQAVKNLVDGGANVAGVVLSMVDPEKHARYGFGDSGYYDMAVKAYYAH